MTNQPMRGATDPYAGAQNARIRKLAEPSHRSVEGRNDVNAAIIAQGTCGGLDRASYKALHDFATASGNTRDDGQDPTFVLAQRLQIACWEAPAELIRRTRPVVNVPAWQERPEPLSGPPQQLREDDRLVEASHELLLRAHSNAALKTRWRGDVTRYTGPLEGAVSRTYDRRRAQGRTAGVTAMAAATQRQAANRVWTPPTGLLARPQGPSSPRATPTRSPRAAAAPVSVAPASSASSETPLLNFTCDDIQTDACANMTSPMTRRVARAQSHPTDVSPRSVEPTAETASAHSPATHTRTRRGRPTFTTIACALVWDCACSLLRNRLLASTDFPSPSSAWFILSSVRAMFEGTWGGIVEFYNASVVAVLSRRAGTAARKNVDHTVFCAQWLVDHVIGMRLEARDAEDLLQFRTIQSGRFNPPHARERATAALCARFGVRELGRHWESLSTVTLPRPPRDTADTPHLSRVGERSEGGRTRMVRGSARDGTVLETVVLEGETKVQGVPAGGTSDTDGGTDVVD